MLSVTTVLFLLQYVKSKCLPWKGLQYITLYKNHLWQTSCSLGLFQLCVCVCPFRVTQTPGPTHEPWHLTSCPGLSFMCAYVCICVSCILVCDLRSDRPTMCLFFYFSCIITYTFSSASHSVHGVLGSSVCFGALLCPDHLATICHEWAVERSQSAVISSYRNVWNSACGVGVGRT